MLPAQVFFLPFLTILSVFTSACRQRSSREMLDRIEGNELTWVADAKTNQNVINVVLKDI